MQKDQLVELEEILDRFGLAIDAQADGILESLDDILAEEKERAEALRKGIKLVKLYLSDYVPRLELLTKEHVRFFKEFDCNNAPKPNR
jgi:hypothetical protein